MIHRRILYGLALCVAVLFQIFYTGYLGTLLLVLVIALPPLSLVLSLPGILGGALELVPEAPSVLRGEPGALLVRLKGPWPLPVGRITFRLAAVNRLTGARVSVRKAFRGPAAGPLLREELHPSHCGRIAGRIQRPRICDLLGLFAFPIRTGGEASFLVLPRPAEGERIPPEVLEGREAGVSLKPRPGGGPGEDYDLRPYRPGDPLRAVHWKLSSKLDDLVVRETLEPRHAALVLTFDHFGTPEELDQVLDRLDTLSRLLLAEQRPHRIQWADPDTGAVQDFAVSDTRGLAAALAAALDAPAPAEGRSILDASLRAPGAGGPLRHLHITPGGDEGRDAP